MKILCLLLNKQDVTYLSISHREAGSALGVASLFLWWGWILAHISWSLPPDHQPSLYLIELFSCQIYIMCSHYNSTHWEYRTCCWGLSLHTHISHLWWTAHSHSFEYYHNPMWHFVRMKIIFDWGIISIRTAINIHTGLEYVSHSLKLTCKHFHKEPAYRKYKTCC